MNSSIFSDLTVSVMKILGAFFLSLVLLLQKNSETVDARSDGEGCYGYLTEMVRSSDFPFRYTTKDQINLIIDDDNGERILAQLQYRTSGAGIVGWVKYVVQDQTLLNTSADLDESVRLNYDRKFAEMYAKCTSKLKGGQR